MTTTSEPKIFVRTEQPYMGIRTIAPFSGMFKVIEQLRKEMTRWARENQLEPAGPPFLRYHVIDMRGEMDISFCIPVTAPMAGDERVRADVLPGGRYASLIYTGNGLTGNKTLIEWVRSQDGLAFDRWDTAQGDNFRGRYEAFLTDPEKEHRKTRWEIEVAIKLSDEHP